jgi:hypothetical protein
MFSIFSMGIVVMLSFELELPCDRFHMEAVFQIFTKLNRHLTYPCIRIKNDAICKFLDYCRSYQEEAGVCVKDILLVFCSTLDWTGCCCSGVAATGNDSLVASTSSHYLESSTGCPDLTGYHPATLICSLLSSMPSSVSLDSGYVLIYHTCLLMQEARVS